MPRISFRDLCLDITHKIKGRHTKLFLKSQIMEQVTDAIGNPISLLIERLFWLGLGGFLGVAIITSVLRGLNESKNISRDVSSEELKNLAKKAIQQNTDIT